MRSNRQNLPRKRGYWLGFIALILVVLSLDYSAEAAEESLDLKKIEELSKGKYWTRLLHYKPKFPFGNMRSLVDGPEFFFSSNGSTDPKGEMIETIRAFSKELQIGPLKQHAQCAFPERYRFLKKELNLDIKDVSCPKLEEFLSRFKGQSVSLIFSSAYPNNPGSMFGHTFLRIKSNARPDILDYGISYAAQVGNDESGLAFMFLGLTGGYRGQFSMQPYYTKVNEYVKSESRDIWEYDLNLNAEETDRMLKHVWELETASWFDYYFFDENCAFQLLVALEVAKPEWDISDFPIFVIPGETIKRLTAIPGAVTQVRFRPSLRKKLFQRLEALSSQQKSDLSNLVDSNIPISSITETPVLETAVTFLQYVKQKESGKLSEPKAKLLRELLIRRSELGDSQSKVFDDSLKPISGDTQPELGHFPTRLGIASGVLQGADSIPSYFQELNFKFAYHDLLNNDIGYMPFSQIDFPGLTLRYLPRGSQFYLENFTALSTTSLFPFTLLEKRFSWKLLLEYYSPKDFGSISSHAVHLEGGAGATVELFTRRAIFYALFLGNFEVGSTFPMGFRIGPKLQVATIINPVEAYKLRIAGNLVTDLFQADRQNHYYEFNLDQSLSLSRVFDIRLQFSYYLNTKVLGFDSYRDGKFSVNYYF